MTKEYPFYYTYANKEYEFLFELEHQKKPVEMEVPEYGEYPYISCKIYRKDLSYFFWDWRGILKPNEKIEFELVYDDRVNIKGHVSLFHSNESGYNFVFIDTYFGIVDNVEHFEGNILQINKSPIPPAPPYPPGPTPQPIPIPPDEYIGPAGFRDLFPYLHMQYWPSIQPADEIFLVNFPSTFYSSPFYTALKNLSTGANARALMENEALGYLNSGDFIQSTHGLLFPLNVFPEIYDDIYNDELIVEEEIIIRLNSKKGEYDEELVMTTSYPEQIERIWENIFALTIIEGYQPYKLDQLTKILVVDHILSYLSSPPAPVEEGWLNKLIHASLVLPQAIFPLPSYGPVSVDNELYTGTVVPYAIGDLQMVQHKLKGYEAGDIAHIENVLAGEVKRTKHRKTEISKDSTIENEKTNIQNKNENHGDILEKQVINTINDTLTDTYDYTNLTQSYGPPTTGTLGGSVTQTKNRTGTKESPVKFAKNILSKTVSQMNQQVSERREKMLRNEAEESISHIIDNRKGKGNIRGIYYWLNRIYEMRLVNYGHRFMLEFIIQKPILNELDGVGGPFLFPPIAPALLPNPIHSYKDITIDNYLEIGAYYGIYTLPFPPVANKFISSQINGSEFLCSTQIDIHDGYLPESLTVSYQLQAQAWLITGIQQTQLLTTTPQVTIQDPLGIFASPPIQVAAKNLVLPVLLDMTSTTTSPPSAPYFFVSITVHCKCSDELYDEWKQQIFLLIQQAYELRLKKYEQQMKQQYNTNPELIDKLLQGMVKSACKKILWEKHVSINGIPPASLSPPLSPPEDMVNKPAYNQFFEEAFEWNKMVYALENMVPINNKEDLLRNFENKIYDDKLEKFMASRQIRVMIPVQEGCNYKMLYYLSAGLIFYGEDHLAPIFDSDQHQPLQLAVKIKKVFELSPDFELQEIEAWKMKVPTEMQWLQDSTQLPEFIEEK